MKGRALTDGEIATLLQSGVLCTTKTVYIKNTPESINIVVAVPKRIYREYIAGRISFGELLDNSKCVRYWKR